MPPVSQPQRPVPTRVLHYAAAVAIAVVAFWLRRALGGLLNPGQIYITFYPAIMLAALLGRLGPGLVATAVSALATLFWLLPPYGEFRVENAADEVGLAMFCLMGAFMCLVVELYHRARERNAGYEKELALQEQRQESERRGAEELERRIAERTLEIQAQSRFLEALFQHSLDCLVILDRKFNFIRVNEVYARACHRAVSDFSGHNHFEFYPHPENQAIFENVVRTKTPFQIAAKPFTFPDHPEWGVTYWDWTLVPIVASNGEVDFLVFSLRDVTARERAEQELRSASTYARGLLEASLDPLVTISPEGKITDVNHATEEITGVVRERLIGSDFSQYFTEPEKAAASYRKVLTEGLVRDYPLTIRSASGHTAEVLYNAVVFRNMDGEVQGVFAAARDLTARRQAERALEQSEARYRSLVAASAQIVWATDPTGAVVAPIPGWEEFTGQTFDQYKGAGWLEAIHPADRPATHDAWARAVAGRESYRTESRLRRPDGQYRYVQARGVPVLGPGGVIREWVGTCADITDRKEAERRRDFTNALLALFAQKSTARDYLNSVVEIIRQWSGCQALGIRIRNEKQEIPYEASSGFDPAFLELEDKLSLERDSCCCIRAISGAFEPQDRALLTPGGSYRWDNSAVTLSTLPAEQRTRFRGNCARFGFASLAVVPINYRNETIGAIHLADRRPEHFRAENIEFIEAMAPLIGEAIHRFHAETELAAYRDQLEVLVQKRTRELEDANARLQVEIAQRRQVQESLQEAARELERSNRDLEQFAYVASHDLQEPLRAVGGFVRLLQRRFPGQVDTKAAEFIAGAADGAARMERLITDLLAFSRVGTRGGAFAPADLNLLLRDALHNLQASIRAAQAVITNDPLPTLVVDSTQIVQLFQNLISNALKFRSDRPPQIHILAQQQQDTWCLGVRDNGIGIERQYFDRIFQIFQRLHTRRHYPGTGIGLAICKRIVERHRGEIRVESEPGVGSTFFFTLPQGLNLKEHGI